MKIPILYGPRDLRMEEHSLDTDNLKPKDIWIRTALPGLRVEGRGS